MFTHSDTNTVQNFVRSVAWLATFLILLIPLSMLMAIFSSMEEGRLIVLAPFLILNLWVSGVVAKMFFVIPEWQNMVLLRLGKFHEVKKAGFFIVPPFIYSVAAITDMRIETNQVEATATLTKDNVPTRVTAAIEFRVEDPRKAVIDVQNYRSSIIWLATEALKNTIGSMDLKDLLSERNQIADSLREQLDAEAVVYGIDIRAVRITDIDTPPTLVEELAVIARARRNAEAKKVEAEAEILVAEKIAEAAKLLGTGPEAMKLRELQILSEMSKEESSMIIIYPQSDEAGRAIANAAAGSSHGIKKLHNKNEENLENR